MEDEARGQEKATGRRCCRRLKLFTSDPSRENPLHTQKKEPKDQLERLTIPGSKGKTSEIREWSFKTAEDARSI